MNIGSKIDLVLESHNRISEFSSNSVSVDSQVLIDRAVVHAAGIDVPAAARGATMHNPDEIP